MQVIVACSLLDEEGDRCVNPVLRQAWVGKLGWMPVCEEHIEGLNLPAKEAGHG